MVVQAVDWVELAGKELEGQRDAGAVFRMPLCRLCALYLQKNPEDRLAEINRVRVAKGLRPVKSW